MAVKRFVVILKDGSTQPIDAESGDEDDEPWGYVFFIANNEIVGLFAREIVDSWQEEPPKSTPSADLFDTGAARP